MQINRQTFIAFFKQNAFLRKHAKALRRALNPLPFYLVRKTTKPLSTVYGLDRGLALDRFYIDSFVEKNASDITGTCLELLNNGYTLKYGNTVTKSDILDIDQTNNKATIIADLRNMPAVASDTYDCIILTQVLQFIDEPVDAIRECHRVLKPGGVLLVTVPCLGRIDCVAGESGDFWRFTEAGIRHLFSKAPFTTVHSEGYGNCRSGMYFLAGAAQEDVSKKELEPYDSNFPVLISLVARK